MAKVEINIPPQDTFSETSVARYVVNEMLRQSNMTLSAAIEKYNLVYHDNQTIQNISNKLTRNSMRLYELAQLASVCNFRLCLVGNVKDSPIVNKDDFHIDFLEETQGEQSAIGETVPRPKDNIKPIRQTTKTFDELLSVGFCESKTVNFGFMIIAGARAEEAAKWVEEHLTDDMTELQERTVYLKASRMFGIKFRNIEKNMAAILGLSIEDTE